MHVMLYLIDTLLFLIIVVPDVSKVEEEDISKQFGSGSDSSFDFDSTDEPSGDKEYIFGESASGSGIDFISIFGSGSGASSSAGSNTDSTDDSRPNGFIFTQGHPTRLYVEREAPNIAYLITHPFFGATLDVAGTYTCVAVGKYVNTTKELVVEVLGLFNVYVHSYIPHCN